MSKQELSSIAALQKRIYTLRGVQVMLDEELAVLFGVATKRLNEQVKRNIERFPAEFCFQLEEADVVNLRSQNATSSWGGRRYMPYAFTEQGIAMVSAVLHSDTAIEVSIRIMKAFVAMRRFLNENGRIFQRLDTVEWKQSETDKKVEQILGALEEGAIQPKQGIFYDGQVFDAWVFVSGLVRKAKKSILLIDNYVDESVLALFAKRKKGVVVTILTKTVSRQLEIDVKKFNEQYPPLEVRPFTEAHDRFLILDGTDLYHFGASLKDLGKRWFAFSRMETGTLEMLRKAGAG